MKNSMKFKKSLSLFLSFALLISACFTAVSVSADAVQSDPYFAVSTNKKPYAADENDTDCYKAPDTAELTVRLYEGDGSAAQSGKYYVSYLIKSDNNDAALLSVKSGENSLEKASLSGNCAYTGDLVFEINKRTPGYVSVSVKLYLNPECTDSVKNIQANIGVGFSTAELTQQSDYSFDLTDFIKQKIINTNIGLNEKLPQRNLTLAEIYSCVQKEGAVTVGNYIFKSEDTDSSDGMISTFDSYPLDSNNVPTEEANKTIAAYEAYWAQQCKEESITVILHKDETYTDGDIAKFDIYHFMVETAISKRLDGSEYSRPLAGSLTLPKDKSLSSCEVVLSFAGYGNYAVSPVYNRADTLNVITITVNNHGIPNELGTENPTVYNLSQYGCDNQDETEFSTERNHSVEKSFYMQTVLRAGRALQFVETLGEWDGINVSVTGPSYGGFQSLVACAIDGLRTGGIVTKCAVDVPWMCEPGSENVGMIGSEFRPEVDEDSVLPTYFNTVNYVKLIKCPLEISAGLGDDICPPAGTAVLYNTAKANCNSSVKLTQVQDKTHGTTPNTELSRRNGITYEFVSQRSAKPDENGFTVESGVLTAYTGQGGDITVPASVVSIADGVFQGNSTIETVSFEAGSKLRTIGQSAFAGCNNLISVDVPAAVTSIGSNAFNGDNALKTLSGNRTGGIAPFNKLTEIGDAAFSGCSSLCDEIRIPGTVNNISDFAFYGCSSVAKVLLNEGIKTIEIGAFAGAKITEIKIPSTAISIAHAAFQTSGTLSDIYVYGKNTEIAMPSSSNHDNDAFKGADSAVTVYGYDGSTAQKYCQNNNYTFKSFDDMVITAEETDEKYFGSYLEDFKAGILYFNNEYTESGLTDTDIVTPSAIKTHHYHWSESGLTRYDAGTGTSYEVVNRIHKDTFKNNNKIRSLIISDGLTVIEGAALDGCSALETLVIPQTVTDLGNWQWNLSSLKTVAVLNSDVKIPDSWLSGTASDSAIKERVTFYGIADSKLESWCEENGYTFRECRKYSVLNYSNEQQGGLISLTGWNGDAAISGSKVAYGASLILSAKPNTGYVLDSASIKVEGLSEGSYSVKDNGDGTYKITLPAVFDTEVVPERLTVKASFAAETPVIVGDANGDQEVDVKDLVRIKRYLDGITTEINKKAVDFDGDGEILTADMASLRKFLLS